MTVIFGLMSPKKVKTQCGKTGVADLVGIYKVSSLDKKPKVTTAHKQNTNQYTSIITWLKPSKREIVHGSSQRGHFRKFTNIKRKVTYVSLINGYQTNDPP